MTVCACREDYAKPGYRTDEWTSAEDEQLLKLSNGGCADGELYLHTPNRGRQPCRQRLRKCKRPGGVNNGTGRNKKRKGV